MISTRTENRPLPQIKLFLMSYIFNQYGDIYSPLTIGSGSNFCFHPFGKKCCKAAAL